MNAWNVWKVIFKNRECQPGTFLGCVAAVSFPFPGGDRTSKRKSGRAKEHAWGEQNIGEKWGGGELLIFRTPSRAVSFPA